MRQYLIAPVIITALVVAVAIASPAAFSFGFGGEPELPATPAPTDAPTATPTAVHAPTAQPAATPGSVPAGMSGRLTFIRGGEKITIQMPGGEEVSRERAGDLLGVESPDGRRSALAECDGQGCSLEITGPARAETVLRFEGGLSNPQWSPDSARLAYVVDDVRNDEIVRRELVVLDPSMPDAPVVLHAIDGYAELPFVWSDATHIVLGNAMSIDRLGLDGSGDTIAQTEALVWYFYPSPDRRTVAFTQDGAEGWRLLALNLESDAITDYGNMGSDPAGTHPPEQNASVKGPMFIAWSPDGRQLGFGGGFEPPYIMTIVDLDSAAVVRTEFAEGYPGEIKWSPDGTRVAVSTYDVERTRHEVYIVDPEAGESWHVSSGCVIVWSPDGRFLAQHIDNHDGVGIVDVESGAYGFVTQEQFDTPIAWE